MSALLRGRGVSWCEVRQRGTLGEGTVSGPHHSPTFRADDAAVPIGMRVMSNVLLDYMIRRAQGAKP